MKVVGIIGSVFGSKTKIALETLKFSENVDYEIIDLANYDLPFADGRVLNDYNEDVIEIVNKLMDADGIIFGTPIYQASISGSLKNLFDLLPVNAINDKVTGMIITSGSEKHYLVGQNQLIPILDYLKADVINKYVFISQEYFDATKIINDGIHERLEALAFEVERRVKLNESKYDF